MKLKTYSVQIPISGEVFVTVEARNEEDAKEKAFDKCSFRIVPDHPDDMQIGDIEAHDRLCYGNVCCAICREAYVEELHV